MRVVLRHCLRASAAMAAASASLVLPASFGLPRSSQLPTLGIATSTRAFGRAPGTTQTSQLASPFAASRTNALILYFFENYPYFKGTLMPQMVMIKYDFIISDYHLNQRSLRSIIKKLSINIKNRDV